jgi:membrane fusion protein (multidrug efflux system)
MRSFFLLLLLMFTLGACGSPTAAAGQPAAAPARPVEVGVITVVAADVALTRELPGRVTPRRLAEVRARVNGIVEKRLFTEGTDVKEGQPLFSIESSPYEANLAAARASLARAEASVKLARETALRDEELLRTNAVSREEAQAADATLRVAEADAAAGRAALKTARINKAYTVVTAPVAGRIGRSAVTEGAYVQQAGATLMATIQQIDSVYVDIVQSSAELLRMRRDLDSHKLERADGAATVRLVLEDGSAYDEPGTLQFADVTVDPDTGSVSLRALFPNPRGLLLPGMFVRARIDEGVRPQAILVPQRALTRDTRGQAVVNLVGPGNKVERRTVVADRAVGNAWLISEGLAPGEQVILDGLQKIRPGVEVTPVPATPDKPADARPTDAEPADAAPPTADARPADAKPADAKSGDAAPPTAPAKSADAAPAAK